MSFSPQRMPDQKPALLTRAAVSKREVPLRKAKDSRARPPAALSRTGLEQPGPSGTAFAQLQECQEEGAPGLTARPLRLLETE